MKITQLVNNILIRYDRNRDAQISYDPSMPGNEVTSNGDIEFLHRIDQNRDFFVDTRELTSYVRGNVDQNGDGDISEAELKLYALNDPNGGRVLSTGFFQSIHGIFTALRPTQQVDVRSFPRA